METKYGKLTTKEYNEYMSSLIDRVFAILPMKESNTPTLSAYIDNLSFEIFGMSGIFENVSTDVVISLTSILNCIKNECEHDIYRKQIFNCCNTLSLLKLEV